MDLFAAELRTWLSKGSMLRLQRIMELKKCNTEEALDYCISTGWLAAERRKSVTNDFEGS